MFRIRSLSRTRSSIRVSSRFFLSFKLVSFVGQGDCFLETVVTSFLSLANIATKSGCFGSHVLQGIVNRCDSCGTVGFDRFQRRNKLVVCFAFFFHRNDFRFKLRESAGVGRFFGVQLVLHFFKLSLKLGFFILGVGQLFFRGPAVCLPLVFAV